MSQDDQLTVSDLRRLLAQLEAEGHGDLPVELEGCDCAGQCVGATVYPWAQAYVPGEYDGPVVALRRGGDLVYDGAPVRCPEPGDPSSQPD